MKQPSSTVRKLSGEFNEIKSYNCVQYCKALNFCLDASTTKKVPNWENWNLLIAQDPPFSVHASINSFNHLYSSSWISLYLSALQSFRLLVRPVPNDHLPISRFSTAQIGEPFFLPPVLVFLLSAPAFQFNNSRIILSLPLQQRGLSRSSWMLPLRLVRAKGSSGWGSF
jgi:hypothetical protein